MLFSIMPQFQNFQVVFRMTPLQLISGIVQCSIDSSSHATPRGSQDR